MDKKYLDYEGLRVLVEQLKESLSVDDSVEQHNSIYNFPNTGKTNVIYVDKSKNVLYRWDDDNAKYYQCGTNIEDIEYIVCGDSKDNDA